MKVRQGPPQDLSKDLALPIWAGVIPLTLTPGEATSATDGAGITEIPDYVRQYSRGPRN